MSRKPIQVDEAAKAKDEQFRAERKGSKRYIKRHSKQARWTHGITVICCIWLMVSGCFVFVPPLAQAVGPDAVFAMRMSHRVIGVVFVALVAALVLRSTVWKENVVAGAWMMVLVGAVCGLMYYVRKRYPGKRKVGGTMDTVISALLILFCVVYVGMGAMALVAMNK